MKVMLHKFVQLFRYPILAVIAGCVVLGIGTCLINNIGRGAELPADKYENVALGKPYTLYPKPNYEHSADPEDKTQLTDGIYTKGYFWTQKSTVGWRTKINPLVITIDLGKIEPICGVSYNTAAWKEAQVGWPVSISILVSDDGCSYYPAGDLVSLSNRYDMPNTPIEYSVHRYWTDKLKTHGRYVQFVVDAGEGELSFVDEIEVYRGTPDLLSLPLSGPEIPGGDLYFKHYSNDIGVNSRLNLDIYQAKEAVKEAGLSKEGTELLLNELAGLEVEIGALPPTDSDSFQAVMPINDLEAKIYAVRGKIKHLQGLPTLQAWVNNPYDFITPAQGPDKDSKDQISVQMMRNEWRSAVVNLTNSSEDQLNVYIRIDGLPGGTNPEYINVYQVAWTDTREHIPVAAALIEAKRDSNGYFVSIPAGMTRQVWLSFHPETISAGIYNGHVSIIGCHNNVMDIPLTWRLFPMAFPQQPTLHFGGWDFTDSLSYGITEMNREAVIKHLQERFVDSPWGFPDVLKIGAFDAEGNMVASSTQRFDTWVGKWPHARRYCIYLNVPESLDGSIGGSYKFNTRVASWIDYWVNHAISVGIKP